ncbi:EI24 domain-containing protein, partial [Myxococcota bacterium]|nr:EI24 domain-containing protein [Myxococcota bacterium]
IAEAKRLLFFISIWGVLVLVGLVIPGAQLITGPLIILVTIALLPLQFSGYTLDRRRVSFKHRRQWLRRDMPTALGFGVVAFAACFVPFVNLVMMPGLVTAGTLLVLRNPPDSGL